MSRSVRSVTLSPTGGISRPAADAQLQPATAQRIDDGGVLGQPQRILEHRYARRASAPATCVR